MITLSIALGVLAALLLYLEFLEWQLSRERTRRRVRSEPEPRKSFEDYT